MPNPIRRIRGFEAASGLLKTQVRVAGESRGFAVTRLLTHWTEIAGEEMARVTRPVKVGYGREGMGPIDPAVQQEAARTAAPIRDDGLRAALEAMAQNILKRRKPKEI
jgi:hypothetical protein